MRFVKLNNNIIMPSLGLGTYKSKKGEETYNAVKVALESGYRHIDTASIYDNEESIGMAIKDSHVKREDIFVTTKLWNTDQGYESTKKAFYKSLEKLNLDYIDLYLIHWPKTYELAKESYLAMEELYNEGKIRALGVSNFNIHHLNNLLTHCNISPTVNQVELHPGLQQIKLQDYCEKHDIKVVSHSPMMRGRAFKIEELQKLAEKYNKNVVNIVVRWGLQRGVIMIPKSVTPKRIINNYQVFDFSLSDEDMKIIRNLNNAKRIASDPDNIDY